ncbi:1-acyl-sn-glycerol-3-phosphate acyltransferase [Branchiibius hedensis]|uniref:1-acyl-sn-glycerol-3-phosphate acyltransferase n=1 Tax=Branchiibius hedensis TaxID=672460 RepID=A0A2Y9BSS8_9MICO|nr:lysophospholipid acyltransferase family protein [Branchiibius hedensis]PWJ24024.1 1-acyl-sn-glycerol-3-phosphate acyltransferase [Branchiibius hedensis]SSA32842.1 1-acyl-sn-glycerol-3-phosphate acyltransferase [Branchiibius hedensis]
MSEHQPTSRDRRGGQRPALHVVPETDVHPAPKLPSVGDLLGELEGRLSDLRGYFSRRLRGEYDVDDFGFDEDFTENIWLPILRPMFQHWFRVEVRGAHHLPTDEGALIVANHSGTIPIDGLMAQVGVFDTTGRHLRLLAADLVFASPLLGVVARQSGATMANPYDAEHLLADGHLVAVYPEGFKGVGKPFAQRYQLQRFGRGGYVTAALRSGTPIVPCAIVGAEEIYPKIADIKPLARLLGFPYFPVTPFFPWFGLFGAIPLPTKWTIEFGAPIVLDGYEASDADDPAVVFEISDQVRETIQQSLYALLAERDNLFW